MLCRSRTAEVQEANWPLAGRPSGCSSLHPEQSAPPTGRAASQAPALRPAPPTAKGRGGRAGEAATEALSAADHDLPCFGVVALGHINPQPDHGQRTLSPRDPRVSCANPMFAASNLRSAPPEPPSRRRLLPLRPRRLGRAFDVPEPARQPDGIDPVRPPPGGPATVSAAAAGPAHHPRASERTTRPAAPVERHVR